MPKADDASKVEARPRGRQHRWAKGVSGNPTGRKAIPYDVKVALEALVPDAIDVLRRVVKSKSAGIVQIKAAESILNRVYGKPIEQVQHTGADGNALRIEVVYREMRPTE